MFSRREFLMTSTMALGARDKMTSKERIDRALKGEDVDRPPFTLWHHFHLEKLPAERHAQATLDFHRKFRTDLIKVMSDYPYPKPPNGDVRALKATDNPFPEQIRALEIIRDSAGGGAYFVETIFNPYNRAQKVFSKPEVQRLRKEQPQVLLDAIEAIAKSEAAHARRSIAAGAAGIFLAIDNAQDGVLTREEYAKFSEPFDRMVLDAASGAPLNALHLHGDKVYLDHFFKGWPAPVINYSVHGTRVGVAEARRQYAGVLMCGIDEVNFRKLPEEQLRQQWHAAAGEAGKKFILAPGCSVPDDSTDEELGRLPAVVGA
jgi:uroporphyrinogen decarboxylase